MKKIIEGQLNFDKMEDRGQAFLTSFEDNDDSEDGMFVIIQSWIGSWLDHKIEKSEHKKIQKFVGKKVRVTIETIEN